MSSSSVKEKSQSLDQLSKQSNLKKVILSAMPPKRNFRKRPLEEEEEEDDQSKAASSEEEEKRRSVPNSKSQFLGLLFVSVV